MKVPSILPSSESKKNWMPRLAWTSVRLYGSVGLSALVPATTEEKVPVVLSMSIIDAISLSEAGFSGVTKYL
jgi:hypothetical protein